MTVSESGVGRCVAGGNSNGDVPTFEFNRHKHIPSMQLLVLHDDAYREFDKRPELSRWSSRPRRMGLNHRQHQG
jgi:hypothetical protein